MNSISIHKIRTGAVITAVCIALLLTGYGAGLFLGSRFMESIILKQVRFPLLLSRPVNQFYDIYALINSNNPFSRLSGYYSLVDNNMINEQFIAERYNREQFIVIKRTLLWVLSHSKDTGKAVSFYSSIYKASDDSLKKDILRLMMRLDKKYYDSFIRKNRIDRTMIPD